MIYLAHSKAPSNEVSSRRTQSSASSSIERTFRHWLQDQSRLFLFRWTNRLPSRQGLLHSPDGSITRSPTRNFRKLRNLLTDGGCTCRSRRTEEQKATKSNTFNATLGASSKTANTPENVTHLLSLLLLLKKKNKQTPTLLLSSQSTILILMIVTLSTKILWNHWKITEMSRRVHHATHFRITQLLRKSKNTHA